jgi:anti-anti-sigma regulatory factor
MKLAATVLPDLVNGVIVVELRGLLDLSTVPMLRAVLLKCLAQAPDAVIIDVADLRVTNRTHLTAFPAALHAGGGSAVAMVVCGADAELRSMLHGRVLGSVSAQPDRATALAAVASAQVTPPRRAEHRLAPTPGAPSTARRLVIESCTAWGLAALAEPAILVISELVSNAVQHAGTELVVRLARRGDLLHLSVQDGSRERPRVPGGRHDDAGLTEGGRGLHLVDTYAAAWGSTVGADGKTVWAVLRPPANG